MAESAPKIENPLYKYDNIERVWNGYVRRNRSRHSNTCRQYFSDFIRSHRSYQFSITRLFDGTKQIFVDLEMYKKMKEDLEKKTELSLPDIFACDMNRSENVVERKEAFTNQQQFNELMSSLETENNNVRARAYTKAAQHTSSMREFLSSRRDIKFITFDIEVYDKDMQTFLEIGLVKFTLKQDDQPEYFHAIVNDDLHNREGFDNRDKFKFGTSKRMSLKEAAGRLQREIEGADAVVLHAGHHDEQYLNDNGITIVQKTTFDTQVLALNLLPSTNQRMITWGLKKILEEMRIPFDQDILHNAGNDAHYTMMAFKALVKKAMPGKRF